MKYYEIPHTNMRQSAVIQGCMRFKGMSSTEVEQIVNLCLENGINSFDHADVYGTAGMRGECEQLFGGCGWNIDKIADGISGCSASPSPGYFDGTRRSCGCF